MARSDSTPLEPRFQAPDRRAWREWLSAHHDTTTEVWLVYFKKHTGKPSVTYPESVKEALCFGWIDGIAHRLDDETYVHRFTPRRPRSKWSPTNVQWAKELIAAGEMTPAGQAAFDRRVELPAPSPAGDIPLAPELEAALRAHEEAWRNFGNMAPGYRRQYTAWIMSAKRPETRERRLQVVIQRLAENRKPGL